jgi:hypothetical protein
VTVDCAEKGRGQSNSREGLHRDSVCRCWISNKDHQGPTSVFSFILAIPCWPTPILTLPTGRILQSRGGEIFPCHASPAIQKQPVVVHHPFIPRSQPVATQVWHPMAYIALHLVLRRRAYQKPAGDFAPMARLLFCTSSFSYYQVSDMVGHSRNVQTHQRILQMEGIAARSKSFGPPPEQSAQRTWKKRGSYSSVGERVKLGHV